MVLRDPMAGDIYASPSQGCILFVSKGPADDLMPIWLNIRGPVDSCPRPCTCGAQSVETIAVNWEFVCNISEGLQKIDNLLAKKVTGKEIPIDI